METDHEIAPVQTSSFKLQKMSKGYNWEIKIYNDDLEIMKKQIEEMNSWAYIKFGGT